MDNLILKTKPIRVSFNMFCCAVVFAPWGVKPRETISGFVGRKAANGGARPWKALAKVVDVLHPHEPEHCAGTSACEERMRIALYHLDSEES